MKFDKFKNDMLVVAVVLPFALGGCVIDAGTNGTTNTTAGITCPPELSGNECDYFKDGYRAGAKDADMGMSMAYQRHEGYDSRFERSFARGYEAGWLANR